MIQFPGQGLPNGLMVIIDFPTENEAKVNEICFGTPRRIVDSLIKQAWRGPVYWTYAVPSGKENKKTVPVKVWRSHVQRLQEEVKLVNPKKILCLGGIAVSTLLNPKKAYGVMHVHGQAFDYNGIYTVAAYNPYMILKDKEYFRDLAWDIRKLFKSNEVVKPITPDWKLIINQTDLINALTALNSLPHISCDIETTGLNPVDNEIESIGFGFNKNDCYIIPMSTLKTSWAKSRLTAFFRLYKGTIIYHNAKFDMSFISHYIGEEISARLADTMLMNYALDERGIGKYSAHSLKDLARKWFDAPDYKMNFKKWNATPVEKRDYEAFYSYQSLDLIYTLRLYRILAEELGKADSSLVKVIQKIFFPATKAFMRSELYGIKLDIPYLEEKRKEYTKEYDEGEVALWHTMGKLHFSPKSPQQVNGWLKSIGIQPKARKYGEKGEQDLGTGKNDLKEYARQLLETGSEEDAHNAKIIEEIVRLRHIHHINSTYFDGLLRVISKDGRLRTSMRIAGTTTGRIASAEPNVQNIPSRDKTVKKAFITELDELLIQLDFKQLEMRMIAFMSKDEALAEQFRRGVDFHKVIAAAMFRKPVEEVTDFERFLAKAVGFGIVYGRQAEALSSGAEMDYYVEHGGKRASASEMQELINGIYQSYPDMARWIKAQHKTVRQTQQIKTLFGRLRRFPYIDKQNLGEVLRAAQNTPIQSAASDLCLLAMIKISNNLPPYAKVLLTVHDSILLTCKAERVDEIIPTLRDTMVHGIIDSDFITFDVDVEVGSTWGTLEKYEPKLVVAA